MYSRAPFSPTHTPSSNPVFRSDVFGATSNGYSNGDGTVDHTASINGLSKSSSDLALDTRPAPAIMIRKLPRTTSDDTLMSMLIFAGDLIDTEFIRSPYPDDQGFVTAVARFRSQAGAIDAQQKLNGKPNTTKDANMVIELHNSGMAGTFERRATIDATNGRNQTSSTSSGNSSMAGPRSRYGSAFQSSDKISPPLISSSSAGSGNEFPVPDTNSHFHTLFSPQSPLANGFETNRISGKSIINDNGADDETGELLKDPVAYAKNGQKSATSGRRPTVPQIPVARFGSLSLSTANGVGNGLASPPLGNVTSPRGAIQSPMSPTNVSTSAYSMNYPRPQYPPVNPADQNPPCNTLYVGNLPIDASEDELKTIFSKQRGYKRLCFRTKQNGPMCFVEFEDVSFATKALNELYGHPLHNSIKGGIRLSFSKNPLGVRSGQTNGISPNGPMSPPAMASGYSNATSPAGGFSSVSGPPPGLAAPPGLTNGGHRSPPIATGMDGMFASPFGMSAQAFNEQMSPRNLSGGLPPNMTGQFGRENRAGYTDYMLGR